MEKLWCCTCDGHIGYVYEEVATGFITCLNCGLEEIGAQEQEDEEACSECLIRGCNGECF